MPRAAPEPLRARAAAPAPQVVKGPLYKWLPQSVKDKIEALMAATVGNITKTLSNKMWVPPLLCSGPPLLRRRAAGATGQAALRPLRPRLCQPSGAWPAAAWPSAPRACCPPAAHPRHPAHPRRSNGGSKGASAATTTTNSGSVEALKMRNKRASRAEREAQLMLDPWAEANEHMSSGKAAQVRRQRLARCWRCDSWRLGRRPGLLGLRLGRLLELHPRRTAGCGRLLAAGAPPALPFAQPHPPTHQLTTPSLPPLLPAGPGDR